MLLSNILSGIEVCIQAVATLFTEEETLRTTIGTMLMSTFATGLARVARVDLDHSDTMCLCLVLDKRVQLGKAPTMQASLVVNVLVLLASAHLGGLSKVLEIFQDDSCPCGSVLYNAFAEDVVMVSASPKLFPAQLLEVSLGRASAFGLQLSFQPEGTPFLFFPASLTQEVPSRGDCWAIETQVNTDHLVRCNNGRFKDADNDMEPIAALAIAQVCAARLVSNVLSKVSRHREGQFNAPTHGRKATGQRLPLDPVRTLVITDTSDLTVRTSNRLESRNGLALLLGFLNLFGICLFLLGLPGKSRFHGFSGLDTGRTDQLSRQIRVLRSQRIVRAFVQLHTIVTGRGKALVGNGIKASRMLLKGCLEYACLLRRWGELHGNRSIHAKRISYIPTFVKWLKPGVSENGGIDECACLRF